MGLIGTNYLPLLLVDNDPGYFSLDSFIEFMKANNMAGDYMRQYRHCPIMSKTKNAQLCAYFEGYGILQSSEAWKIMDKRRHSIEYYAEHPEELAANAESFLQKLEGKTDTGRKAVDASIFFNHNDKFMHDVMADYLIDLLHICHVNGHIHAYEDGIYKAAEGIVHGTMAEIIPSLTSYQRNEVIKYIKVCFKVPKRDMSPPNLIPFKSRIYDITADRFIDYSPEHVFLNRFPWDYKPDAPECTSITGVIEAIADHDGDVVKLLYEAMGNCFYLVNSFRGAVNLKGVDGSNGKSTLLNMITRLCGAENVSSLSLQDTAQRFRLAEIYGKVANIGDDIPNTYFENSATFKMLVTGESVTAEKKGQDPFTFKSYAKLFFAMNEMPKSNDKTRAFYGRILLIPLNHDFSKDPDTGLHDRVWSQGEMECLVCHAVEGLKRLIRQNGFTRGQAVKEAMREYEVENNPVLAFLEEYGEVEGAPTDAVLFKCNEWLRTNGYREISVTTLSNAVSRELGLGTTPKRFGNKLKRVYGKV